MFSSKDSGVIEQYPVAEVIVVFATADFSDCCSQFLAFLDPGLDGTTCLSNCTLCGTRKGCYICLEVRFSLVVG
jgi:hypothetical protein